MDTQSTTAHAHHLELTTAQHPCRDIDFVLQVGGVGRSALVLPGAGCGADGDRRRGQRARVAGRVHGPGAAELDQLLPAVAGGGRPARLALRHAARRHPRLLGCVSARHVPRRGVTFAPPGCNPTPRPVQQQQPLAAYANIHTSALATTRIRYWCCV
jgi:hypothetical protein